MRIIKAEKLTRESFYPFGSFMNVVEPEGSNLGTFYHDKVLFPVSGSMPIGLSTHIYTKPEKMLIKKAEYHNATGEVIVAMDDDVVICLAPATKVPVPEMTKAFLVPKGTAIQIKAGVWHSSGFSINKEKAHMLVLLPERTYMTDCSVALYDEANHMEIEL